ncbi:helix-turn-helix domain-containing protein [Mucilaginibacter celer]|uniref:Helix-turn-helix domain-containing protein n=1 Tax=Mucilaginibacter celer TaxID=2305508 RepID=A0A494VXW4_9SPHI|nr:helix-turn-helix domain-containing protein [Mucilaginibacter celer]AYL98300.1 helix-turn-helix domain-containing protein [Mucilaginibacter celer]
MKTFKYSINENDVKLADFARALALPIRVQIIRHIIENGFSIGKDDLYFADTNRETLIKHISELRSLGLIRMEGKRGNITYHIDQKWFTQMMIDFSAVFGANLPGIPTSYVNMPPSQKNSSTPDDLPEVYPHFGAFIKKHREELNISQENFSQKITINRSQLSRIECGKAAINPDKLKMLAKALYISYPVIKKEYYSYQLAEMIDENGYDESMLASAREKLTYASRRKQ